MDRAQKIKADMASDFGQDVDELIAAAIQASTARSEDYRGSRPCAGSATVCDVATHRSGARSQSDDPAERAAMAVLADDAVPFQWVMFAEMTRRSTEFLGAYIVRAPSLVDAVLAIHRRGHSPGGRVDGAALPLDLRVDPDVCDRLLTYAEALAVRDTLDAAYN